jgi:hypothetical protein
MECSRKTRGRIKGSPTVLHVLDQQHRCISDQLRVISNQRKGP